MHRGLALRTICLLLVVAHGAAAQEYDRAVRMARHPALSPDGKQIAFSWRGDIWRVPAEGGEAQRLTVHEADDQSPAWSPDGARIAFTSDRHGNDDVYVMDARGGLPERITFHSGGDYQVSWRPDGERLLWSSTRSSPPGRGTQIFEHRPGSGTPVPLLAAGGSSPQVSPDARFLAFTRGGTSWWRKHYVGPAQADVWLYELATGRFRRITDHRANDREGCWSHEGKTDLYAIQYDGANLEQWTNAGTSPWGLSVSPDGMKVWYLRSGGSISWIASGGSPSGTVSFRARIVIDDRRERRQKFEDAWRTLGEGFHDPGMNGVDWAAMHDKYLPWIEATGTTSEFNRVFSLLLGELNASHLGIYGPDHPSGPNTGMLGIEWDPSYPGPGMRIASVLAQGPADRNESRILPGETLLSVDGVEAGPTVNLHEVLSGRDGDRVRVRVRGSGSTAAERTVVIRPISPSAEGDLRYEAWVRENRRRVDKASGGRLAYVHVRSMGQPGVDRFEGDLYAVAHGKEGLIIDVRDNGGGWTTDILLAILTVRRHAYTIPRGGGRGYPQDRLPLYAWTRPAGVLINENSFSNAEIFAHAFHNLGRGPLVGVATHGGVISTGGTTLVDGTRLRLPFRGWYTLPDGKNMELHGAEPDFLVRISPEAEEEGTDPQLAKIVEVLLDDVAGENGE